MSDTLIFIDLVLLCVLQTVWCLYYGLRFRWQATPLGPVWLAKGLALASLWWLLLLDRIVQVPDLVFGLLLGPVLATTTATWLWVTVRVRRDGR